jgi:hypothetical protein
MAASLPDGWTATGSCRGTQSGCGTEDNAGDLFAREPRLGEGDGFDVNVGDAKEGTVPSHGPVPFVGPPETVGGISVCLCLLSVKRENKCDLCSIQPFPVVTALLPFMKDLSHIQSSEETRAKNQDIDKLISETNLFSIVTFPSRPN